MRRMKCEYQIRAQRRHVVAMVKALRFRQKLLSGDVYGTLGRAAIEAWESLPITAGNGYPARTGEKAAVQAEVLDVCRGLEESVWHGVRMKGDFTSAKIGAVIEGLLAQSRTTKAKHTTFLVKLEKGWLEEIAHAVEFEMRVRIAHLEALEEWLPREGDHVRVEILLTRLKRVAWQIEGGNYGPWFSHRTKSLYDIYQVIRNRLEHGRYASVVAILPNIPLIEIK